MKILSKTLAPFLKSSLNAYSLRQQSIAENIANVDTPDYRPLRVSFEDNLRRAMHKGNLIGRRSDERHLNPGMQRTVQLEDASEFSGQPAPDVNLEGEMASLAKNQIRFEFASRRLAGTYEAIRTSIIGRVR